MEATCNQDSPGRERLVILGGGMAGQQFCEALVKRGGQQRFRTLLISEEVSPPYDRVGLHEMLVGRTVDDLLLRPPSWYADHEIELRLNCQAAAIDLHDRKVLLADGSSVPYHELVLATGSRAVLPSIPGADLPGVFTYRSHADLECIASRENHSRQVAIIGGGVLGLEIAVTLVQRGLQVTILERSPQLLSAHLDPESAAVLCERVRRQSVTVQHDVRVTQIRNEAGMLRLQLSSGQSLETGMVLAAIGVRPRDELARSCGLEVNERGGIRINDRLQTSASNVYAIGECAAHRENVPGSLAPVYEMADVLAANLSGQARTFALTPAPFISKSAQGDLGVIAYGQKFAAGQGLRRITANFGNACRTLVLRNRVPVGVSAIGDWPELGYLQEIIRSQRSLPRWRLWRFQRTGRLHSSLTQHVSYLPGSTLVCHCMGVTRGMLTDSYSSGQTSLEALARDTGASTVCGTCKPVLREFLGEPALSTVDTRTRKMLLASVAAFLLVQYAIFSSPAPQQQPFGAQTGPVVYELVSRQTSGYVALTLAVLGLGVSLRKYWRRFTLGSLASWRMLHAVLGCSCVGVVMIHTRMQMGSHFNFLLMADFLALVLIGTILGMLMAGELHLNRSFPALQVPVLRRRLTRLHRFVYSLFPILLAFHVLSSYYY